MSTEWIYGRQVARIVLGGAGAGGAKRRPRRIAATPAALADLRRHGVELAGLEQDLLEPRELDRLTGSREHQGVALLVGEYPYVPLDTLLGREIVVVLDEVTDPRNLGAVARTVVAAGAGGIVVPTHRAAHVTPAGVKASAGLIEALDIAQVANVANALEAFKQAGAWVYGAAGEAPTDYREPDYAGQIVLVLGSEGRGLRPLVRRHCDVLVRIPVQPPAESLNVSVAAAVLLYEADRRRHAPPP